LDQRVITHLLTFKFRDPDPSKLAHGRDLLNGLVGKVPTLRTMQAGVNVIASARAHDLGLVATFDDLAGLEAYQVHPDHVEAATWLRAESEVIVAVDFES
jgi:hypothetical protein